MICVCKTSSWTSVNDSMPGKGQKVLATYMNSYGKRRRVIADFIQRHQEESSDDNDEFEYDEETGNYYLIPGWYEQSENFRDYSSFFIHEGTVTHWAELLEPPKEEAK